MRILIHVSIASLILAGSAHAGVYLEMSDHDLTTGKITGRDIMYVQQGKARIEDASGRRLTIFRDNTMIEVNITDKTYEVVDKAAMAQMAGRMNQMYAKMQARLAAMPPEQRAQMESMMAKMGGKGGGMAAPQTHKQDVVDLGGSGSAAGRRCHLWNKTRDGAPEEQLCVVPASSLPGSDEMLTWMQQMGDFFGQFREAMHAQGGPAANMGSSVTNGMTQEIEIVHKLNGFPASTRRYTPAGKLADTEQVLTKWQEQSVPASMFEVPAGFTRKEMKGMAGNE
jgi:hypothetical protein